jgi:hypothetical protein
MKIPKTMRSSPASYRLYINIRPPIPAPLRIASSILVTRSPCQLALSSSSGMRRDWCVDRVGEFDARLCTSPWPESPRICTVLRIGAATGSQSEPLSCYGLSRSRDRAFTRSCSNPSGEWHCRDAIANRSRCVLASLLARIDLERSNNRRRDRVVLRRNCAVIREKGASRGSERSSFFPVPPADAVVVRRDPNQVRDSLARFTVRCVWMKCATPM